MNVVEAFRGTTFATAKTAPERKSYVLSHVSDVGRVLRQLVELWYAHTIDPTRSSVLELWRACGKRDRAFLAVLLGCGLRRRELVDLDFRRLQQREEHWAIVDLVGKGGHIRTVANARVGEGDGGYVDYGSRSARRPGIPMCLPRRQALGRRCDRTSWSGRHCHTEQMRC